MAYRVVFKPSAAKEFRRLHRDILKRIDAELLALRETPRPYGSIKLSGIENLYRIRIGEYRIIYQIQDERLVVLVVRIRHRREVYR